MQRLLSKEGSERLHFIREFLTSENTMQNRATLNGSCNTCNSDLNLKTDMSSTRPSLKLLHKLSNRHNTENVHLGYFSDGSNSNNDQVLPYSFKVKSINSQEKWLF
jgi:hypothetical protein